MEKQGKEIFSFITPCEETVEESCVYTMLYIFLHEMHGTA